MQPALTHLGIACALGTDAQAVLSRLVAGSTAGMIATDRYSPGRTLTVGPVQVELPSIAHAPPQLRSRNNQLLLQALLPLRSAIAKAKQRYGAGRIAVVLGTSTSGVAEAEAAYLGRGEDGSFPAAFDYRQMEVGNPSEFVATELGLSGPAMTISTACSSSAKALLTGRRLLRQGLCDAAIVGGADTLSRFTVSGFGALEAVSPERCNPMSKNRKGINIGEGAALFLMTAEGGPVRLRGGGSSVDAHHVSAPDPTGNGAEDAMRAALSDARLEPAAIDYVNLHGTATPHNDAMESKAVERVFGSGVSMSSTKPLTGHTLGAAGAIEAAFCWLLLGRENAAQRLPPHVYDGEFDPELPPLSLVKAEQRAERLSRIMSVSFGFFGNNAALILEAQP
ncbi:MAG TPA: beta-ketoacyl-[acyl-carrier-protein] synthase family protein [Polyangiaceae bacterium]|nr:beta-ketoacyl-[acyl-carrier-protein] synthase family protein [Polyangiaceae bacterium]